MTSKTEGEENVFASVLREHARTMDMECAPEESDLWAAADEIQRLENDIDRMLKAINACGLDQEQKQFIEQHLERSRPK